MSDVFPVTTDDERDPREDQNENRKREDEIKGDKPPHHDDWLVISGYSEVVAGFDSVVVAVAGFGAESVL